jgi:hypothetical protein
VRKRVKRPPSTTAPTIAIFGRHFPYRPKRGLFWLAFGFPIFFVARLSLTGAVGREPDLASIAIWSALMAVTFAFLSAFTKVLK